MARHSSIFSVLLEIDRSEIPIFIPAFNQPSLLRMTLEQLSGSSSRVIVYDNNSTFDQMIDYLDQIAKDVDVVFSGRNMGPRIFTEDLDILRLMPKYFVVTDPDLIHNADLPPNHLDEMRSVIEKHRLAKAGMAIEIYDKEERERFVDSDRITLIEEIYWQFPIGRTSSGDQVYDAYIDTTYSLNKRDACIEHRRRNLPTFRYPSARIGGRYTCQHVGWWKKELMPQSPEETDFYLKNQKWSHTENVYYR